ncbi:MAG TPA: bifunctional diguanylate cyclase/phosphodiesterase [Solirubrobacteraceae bacterium]
MPGHSAEHPPQSRLDLSRAAAARRAHHRSAWIAATALLVAIGIAGSVLAAHLAAQSDSQRSRSAFTASAASIASTLTVALQHEEDLVVSARAFVVGNPNSTQAAFQQWSRSVEALARYPELEGGGLVVIVPSGRLAQFIARQTAAHASAPPGGRPFEVMPTGARPFYCLVALTLSRPGNTIGAVPAGFDYCAIRTPARRDFLEARDSGQEAYLPYKLGTTTVLVIYAPVYRGGVVPATTAARRRLFIGAFATTVAPNVILATALRGHSGVAVNFRYGGGSSPVSFHSGTAPAGAQTTTLNLGRGWTMGAAAAGVSGGIFADSTALILLLGGITSTVLLALLVYVLGTGRTRALSMVREKTREVSYQALHDTLTGLPNRALVLDRAERMLARARRDPTIVSAALYVDIDRFKHVNDSFGHAVGDHLLNLVGERLSSVVRDQDTVGRLGGDEFIVLLESATLQAPPDLVAERVIEVMREPVELDDGQTFSFSVSIGVGIGLRGCADDLLRDADMALYTAKEAGKDRAVLFQATMQRAARDRLQLEADLGEALEREQFFLLYQPILDLDSERIVGVEALIRWRHPTRGVVAPDDFIPLAEETGRIVPIGRWVLDEACRQGAAWEAKGVRLGMSVNVSAYQLDRDGFSSDLRRALQASEIDPSLVTIEITETALMRDVNAASARLKEIKSLGVRIAIDDFGTGSSSLAYLRQFAADSLKIDRTFIAEMGDSSESAAIIHTLVELGEMLGIETLAEGIEQPGQLRQLRDERCDRGQGFLFAHPLDPEGVERFVCENAVSGAASSVS